MNTHLEKIYNDVQTQILSEIRTEEGITNITITNILTKLLRLQQITGGYVSKGKGYEKKLLETPKLDAIVEQVEQVLEAKESIIIWCRFTKSIDMIANALNKLDIKYVIMDGRTKDKYETWKGFQKSKLINVFIGQVESGGLGIELYKIDENGKAIDHKYQTMVHYENTWVLDDRIQAQGRIHRATSVAKCRYIDLVVENTIDEKILNTLQNNKKVADAIMQQGIENFLK
jgi:SNF2 family DNA or RNA helicase